MFGGFTCKSGQNREPTSWLEPLDLPSLRVGGQWLLSVAEARVLLSALIRDLVWHLVAQLLIGNVK